MRGPDNGRVVSLSCPDDRFGQEVRIGSIVLKNSATNSSKQLSRNDDSISQWKLNHRYSCASRCDRILSENSPRGVFQHNRSLADMVSLLSRKAQFRSFIAS